MPLKYIAVCQTKHHKELWYSSGIKELLFTPPHSRFASSPQAPGLSEWDQRRHGIDLLYRENQVPLHYYRPDRGTARHWFPTHLPPQSTSLSLSSFLFVIDGKWEHASCLTPALGGSHVTQLWLIWSGYWTHNGLNPRCVIKAWMRRTGAFQSRCVTPC